MVVTVTRMPPVTVVIKALVILRIIIVIIIPIIWDIRVTLRIAIVV